MDGPTRERLAALVDLTGVARSDIDWLSLEDGGITALRIRGMVPASKRGQQRDAAPVFVAHSTTVQGLDGILSNRQVLGSETLNNIGFWGVTAPWTSPDRSDKNMGEMLRVVNRVAKSGLNGCGVVVGLCGHMAWTPMTAGGHAEEAEVVATGRLVHMRKGAWHRLSIPVDYCTITHLFLLPEAFASADAYLRIL